MTASSVTSPRLNRRVVLRVTRDEFMMTLKSDVTIDISGFNLGVYIALYVHPQKIVLAFFSVRV